MTGGCDGHGRLAGELRALAVAALDRLGPALERVRAGAEEAPAADAPCAVCPVCAVIAALRGEWPELAARLAEHGAGLLSVLRTALDEGAGGPQPADDPHREPAAGRPVQHIPVTRPC